MQRRFQFYASRFLAWARKALHPTTVNVYAHYFRRFKKEVGNVPMSRIKPCVLSAWARTWHESQAIVRLFRWCLDDAGLLRSNPVAHAKHPPKGQRRRTLTPREEKKLIRSTSGEFNTLLIGYRETMARPGELRAARWSDVYPQAPPSRMRKLLRAGKAFIVLWDYKSRKRRRLPNEPRVILLSPCIGRLLARRLRPQQPKSAPLFPNTRGGQWTANAVRCRMRRLRLALLLGPDSRGENIVPYSFRHTGATLASALGIRDRLLADALGHTETATTKRYQHLQPMHVQRALRPLWAVRARGLAS